MLNFIQISLENDPKRSPHTSIKSSSSSWYCTCTPFSMCCRCRLSASIGFLLQPVPDCNKCLGSPVFWTVFQSIRFIDNVSKNSSYIFKCVELPLNCNFFNLKKRCLNRKRFLKRNLRNILGRLSRNKLICLNNACVALAFQHGIGSATCLEKNWDSAR